MPFLSYATVWALLHKTTIQHLKHLTHLHTNLTHSASGSQSFLFLTSHRLPSTLVKMSIYCNVTELHSLIFLFTTTRCFRDPFITWAHFSKASIPFMSNICHWWRWKRTKLLPLKMVRLRVFLCCREHVHSTLIIASLQYAWKQSNIYTTRHSYHPCPWVMSS